MLYLFKFKCDFGGSIMLKKKLLDSLYDRYNKREFVHPDPLEFLYNYEDPKDREIVGLIAASLAYGRVLQILKDVSYILNKMDEPYNFVMGSTHGSLMIDFDGFVHRYTNGEEMATFLSNIKNILISYGSLHDCFLSKIKKDDDTIFPALSEFIKILVPDGQRNSLIPSSNCKSPCKRLNLFLRWMVRSDDVDPDGWSDLSRSKLIVPLDTHMHHISLALKLTERKQADMKTALEITDKFKTISPNDPVKYDFSLTRLGIRDDTDMDGFFREYWSDDA
jgi:uncharacterized protein (TIGR02757 family)